MQRGERLARQPCGPEGIDKLVRENATDRWRTAFPGHVHAFGLVLEVVEVQFEAGDTVCLDDVPKLLEVSGASIGRQTHHLPFVSVLGETQVLTGCGVNNASRMWVFDLPEHVQVIV